MRLLALDFGLKKIGTAITDPSQTYVFAKEILANNAGFIATLKQWIKTEKIGLIIMGQSPSKEIKTASEKLAKKIEKECVVPVIFVDEHYTTKQAQELRWTLGLKKKQRQNFDDDSAAAAYILESYLQAHQS